MDDEELAKLAGKHGKIISVTSVDEAKLRAGANPLVPLDKKYLTPPGAKKKTTVSQQARLENKFAGQWEKTGDKRQFDPERQYKFHPDRGWLFDFAWPAKRFAVEIDGGTRGRRVICHACSAIVRAKKRNGEVGRELRIGGGHSRGPAHQNQYEKLRAAQMLGWMVFSYTTIDLQKPIDVVKQVNHMLQGRAVYGDIQQRLF